MSTLLEQARARAAARRERQTEIDLPELLITLVCDVPTDLTAVERLQAEAKTFDKGKARNTHFARALVAAQTREIRVAGEVLKVDGEPMAFRDPELQRDLGVPDAKAAVVELLGGDGDIINVAMQLMEEAGLSGEDDPT